MAIITPTITRNKKFVKTISWVGLDADTFAPYQIGGVAPVSIAVQATNGAANLGGSLDNVDYSPLADLQGVAIGLTDGELSEVSQVPMYIKPTSSVATVLSEATTILMTIRR